MQDNSFHSKYKYIRLLGHGGCGDVYLAENIKLENLWAVKEIVKCRDTSISGYLEPEILKRLNHPALPRICDVYEDERFIYIVEDYIEGICLKQIQEEKGKIEEHLAAEWAVQLCSVLDYLHNQKPDPIIYGDMKPHNIILAKGSTVKLIDFGVSRTMSKAEDKPPGISDTAFIGTKGYAAPEQFMGIGVSPATDIYSLGITLIQLITGFDPVKQNTLYQQNDFSEYLSPEMYEILKNCINPRPEMRYHTAEELMKALRQYMLICLDSFQYKEIKGRSASYPFPKIIAITGPSGTGISTITEAFAEQAAKAQNSVCILDLSKSGDLGKILVSSEEISAMAIPTKVKSKLYYQRANIDSDLASQDNITLYKLLGQLQEKFRYVFIDGPPEYLSLMEQYLDNIFIISDMNPFNMVKLLTVLGQEGLAEKISSRISFIVNKFYKGELKADILIQSILSGNCTVAGLRDLISKADIFKIPYSEKVYLKWMYGYFGEFTGLDSIISDYFKKAVSNIISDKIIPHQSKKPISKTKTK